ncbi:MAG: hypothetical protein QM755_22895 [Luteolibacter sp.]
MRSIRLHPPALPFFCGVLFLQLSSTCLAATKTWNGSSNNSWGIAANWTASGIPATTDDSVFTGTSTNGFNLHLGTANRSIASVTFDATATTPYTLYLGDGVSMPFTNSRTLTVGTGGITVNAGSHVIQGTGTTNAELSLGNSTFNIATGTTLAFNARLGAASSSNNYTKSGGGTLVINAGNGNSGGWNFSSGSTGFTVAAGVLKLATSGATGNSSNKFRVSSGGTLELASAGAYNSANGTLTLNGSGAEGVGVIHATATTTIGAGTGSLTLASSSSVAADASQTLTVNQVITGSASADLTKIGAGTLELKGVNTYPGNTLVSAGSLLVNNTSGSGTGSGQVTVSGSSTRIGGTGTISGTVDCAGILAPGSGGIGTLTTGSTSLSGTLAIEVNGTNADKLTANGDLTLTDATLSVSVVGSALSEPCVIATWTGVLTGTFSSVPSGYTVTYDTDNKQLILTPPTSGYSAWAALNSLASGSDGPTDDPDHDNLPNLLEYVLLANPSVSTSTELPVQTLETDTVHFSFHRNPDSKADTTLILQWGTNLSSWHDISIPDTNSGDGIVGIDSSNPAYDAVTVNIARSGAADGKLFVRLKAVPK